MKLNDIIRYLDFSTIVRIYTDDSAPDAEWEGAVFDIPWSYLDYYLDNDEDGNYEALDIGESKYGSPCFIINLMEKARVSEVRGK